MEIISRGLLTVFVALAIIYGVGQVGNQLSSTMGTISAALSGHPMTLTVTNN